MNSLFFVIFFTALFAVFITNYLNIRHKLGPIKASVYSSVVVSLIFYIINSNISPTESTLVIPLVFFGASFIGMANEKHLNSNYSKIIAALIFSIIYVNTRNIFVGYGGGLGTIAFISVLITYAVNKISLNRLVKEL
jgi:FtsH-binding integral membrane protein